jgi:hypothetical protein
MDGEGIKVLESVLFAADHRLFDFRINALAQIIRMEMGDRWMS